MSDGISETLPVVLVPGLNCSARLYAEQIPALWRFGPVTIADHTRDDSIAAISGRILAARYRGRASGTAKARLGPLDVR
jgi:hypothetical protein